MQREKLFGTDGVRGRAGEGWLAPAPVSALGRAIGTVLRASGQGRTAPRRALLGHDGRRSGPELEAALARGLRRAGYEVASAGLITTPGLALLGRVGDFGVSVMVSASHNPACDNGIKVFGPQGDKLSDELEDAVEEAFFADPEPVPDGEAPPVLPELEEAYLRHLVASAGQLSLDGLSIVLDCANGGASRVAPRVLGRLGAQVTTIASEPDGDNINQACGATLPQALQDEVRRRNAHVGIALDGDGDRCILVDELGNLVHGDGIMAVVACHAARNGGLPGSALVATVMSNRGLHRALRDVGVEVRTVGVGDRQVVERLRADGLALGGEQSGHIVFGADNHHIGDGVYTALRVLRVIRETGAPLSQLASVYRPFPQVLLNVPVRHKPSLAGIAPITEAVRQAEEHLGEDGRVLLRYSGTENLARVMVEGPDPSWIQLAAEELARLIRREIGA